jgi:hypothetical protein
MRKALLLLALVTLVLWLVSGTSPNNGHQPNVSAPVVEVAAQQSCCANPGETDPHDECVGGSCMAVSGCGVSDCSACTCDPVEESDCINNGGYWDPDTCTCSYGCDPDGSLEADCYYREGSWDPYTCTCSIQNACNPGPPVQGLQEYWSDYYCDGTYFVDCDHTCTTYYEYCQDGSLYDQWTECTATCVPSDEYCGDGGGGGGGGGGGDDCVDDPYCYCDWDYCCDDTGYCWEEYAY